MLDVDVTLRYETDAPTAFGFVVAAATTARQRVEHEELSVTGADGTPLRSRRDRVADPPHDVVRFAVRGGPVTVRYRAGVVTEPYRPRQAPAAELTYDLLPAATLEHLNPSRYCESDRLAGFAVRTFGELTPGYERVAGVCNWVYDHLRYVPGSTDSSTTAVDVLGQAAGVCRDYAHLSIALCRALGVPARYVCGYAAALVPQDFHGFFEAYLDDAWYLFDATRMAPLDGVARIAVGRDAADVPFATIFGAARLVEQRVDVVDRAGRDPVHAPATPISTA